MLPMKPSEMFLKHTNILQELLEKNPAQNLEKRLRFATEQVTFLSEYRDDVIFSDETKIMLYYNEALI